MRIKYGFWIIFVGLTLIMTMGVTAQTNAVACPTLIQESFTATEFLCESVPDGQACLGNGVVSTTPRGDAIVQFADPGDLAILADIQRLQARTLNTESQAFTSITAKLEASTPEGNPQIVDMLIFGDTVITNAVDADAAPTSAEIVPATVAAGGGVIVRQDSRVDSNNIWQLLNGESIQAIGRSADNQWIRILIPSPNGGAGWVFAQFVEVTGGQEILPFHTNASPIPEGTTASQPSTSLKPMQAFRLESLLTDASCADTPDSGIMLQSPTLDARSVVEVNGVELQIQGTVYITAQIGDKMTIYNLEGDTIVSNGDNRVEMPRATTTEIPLDASLAPSGAPSAVAPYSQEVADLLVFLPIRVLTRNFEITVTDSSQITTPTDTTTPTETTTDTTTETDSAQQQPAPPPPAATEVPPEEPIATQECPTLVEESYTATEFLCEALNPNTACIGNASTDMIVATARTGVENFLFETPGDQVPSTDIATLTANVFEDPENIWNSIVMTLDVDTTTGATAQATILIFGEIELENTAPEPVTGAPPAPANQQAPPPATGNTTDTTTGSGTTVDGTPAAVEAPGGIIVRAQPRVDTETVGQLQDGDPVIALGRSVDQQWVQITSDNGTTGWVFVQFIAVDGGADALPIIDPAAPSNNTAPPPATNQSALPPPAAGNTATTGEEPEFTSMQSFNFVSSGISTNCVNTPSSGIMIQSPDGMSDKIRLEINGVTFEINGTTYLRASRDDDMIIVGLEGETMVTAQGSSQTVMAGQQSTIALTNELEPNSAPTLPDDYTNANGNRFTFLPIRLLPRSFDVIIPPEATDQPVVDNTTDNSSTTTDTTTTDSTSNENTVINVGGTTVDFNADCQISAGDTVRNLRAGAGTGFDVINVLQVGQSTTGSTQLRGPDGLYWYETPLGWIRSDAGVTTPDCENLPLYGVIYDPTGANSSGGGSAPVAPVPPQATATPVPPVSSQEFGNVCASGGFATSTKLNSGGINYIEFGGVWTGQAGQSITFTAEVPYYRPELKNILTFVNEDGSEWLGSIANSTFTINFTETRRFRVRVSALLGDFVTLRVNC